MLEDPILLSAVRIYTADPVLRVDTGTAQDVAVPFNVDEDYWMSGDGQTTTDQRDAIERLIAGLNTNTDGVTFSASLSARNVLTITSDAPASILWSHANTELDGLLFGYTGDTGPGTSHVAPQQTQFCWIPSREDSRARPPSLPGRAHPVTRGVTTRAISGVSRSYDLSGTTSLGERTIQWEMIRREKILTEYALAAEPYGALEWFWVNGGSVRDLRYYEDKTVRTSSSYWRGRAASMIRPWVETNAFLLPFYNVTLSLVEVA